MADDLLNSIPCYDMEGNSISWGEAVALLDSDERIVAKTRIGDDVSVSTVLLVFDHDWSQKGPPVIFETMIFGGKNEGYQRRYSTKEDALIGHDEAVEIAIRSSWWRRLVRLFAK